MNSQSCELSPRLNLFVGPNGAGKTALLESLHLLVRGRSFRTPKISQVLQHGQSELIVRGEFASDGGDFKAGMRKRRRGGTELRINGEKEQRLSELAKRVPLQVMLPNISDLVFGGPSERRQLLNWGVFHVEHSYGKAWQSLTRLLKHRNSLLRSMSATPDPNSPELNSWTRAYAEQAVSVTQSRERYIQSWHPYLTEAIEALAEQDAGPLTEVDLKFDPGIPWELGATNSRPDGDKGSTQDNASMIAMLLKLLSENFSREVKYGVTQTGPHRAELRMDVAGSAANDVLSRGQGKALALAMMVSQAGMLLRETGQNSVFLIDDVGAELDQVNNQRFFQLLDGLGCQILATTTEVPTFDTDFVGRESMRVFHVEQGKVRADSAWA